MAGSITSRSRVYRAIIDLQKKKTDMDDNTTLKNNDRSEREAVG